MFRTSTFDLPLNRAVSGLAKALAELDPDTLLPDVQAAPVIGQRPSTLVTWRSPFSSVYPPFVPAKLRAGFRNHWSRQECPPAI